MLKIKNIKKSYKNNIVLKDITFSAKKGEIKALIGENGAGKSTLVEIICGIKKYDYGEIYINGTLIKTNKQRKMAKSILGYMPQSFTLYQDLTVQENISYTCAVYGIDSTNVVDEILDLCYLTDKKNYLAQNLSGGYKQLLSYACAIIHKPKLLILDEPTSAMDPIFRKKFWDIVKQIKNQGTTVLLITHHIEELLECDSFACLSCGKIVLDAKVEDYKNQNFIDIEQILNKFRKEQA